MFESVPSQKSFCCHMFHRNVVGLPDHLPAFPTTLVTESGTTCADLRSGSLFGPKVQQSSTTGYERQDLIEISSECTPINVPSRKNSFTTDIDDVPTVVAFDISETIEAGQLVQFTTVHAGARSESKFLRCLCFFGKQQHAAANSGQHHQV